MESGMEHRFGVSGFKVPRSGFGAGTFGGKGPLFSAWGNTQGTRRGAWSICARARGDLFDTADVYSDGASEAVLALPCAAAPAGDRVDEALAAHRRGPNDVGASRHTESARRNRRSRGSRTDYIDLLQLHHFDSMTAVESVASALDDLVRSGKVRLIGASNFSGWQLMKSLAASDRHGYARYVANQTYYSLIGRTTSGS